MFTLDWSQLPVSPILFHIFYYAEVNTEVNKVHSNIDCFIKTLVNPNVNKCQIKLIVFADKDWLIQNHNNINIKSKLIMYSDVLIVDR